MRKSAVPEGLSASRHWRTRAELLAARAGAVPELERQALSRRRFLLHVALTPFAAFAGLMAFSAFDEGDRLGLVMGALFAGIGVAAAWPTVRQAVRNRRLFAELLAWEEVERRGRTLPPGPLAPEHRMPYDARDDDDFEQVARVAGSAAHVRSWSWRYLVRTVSGMGVASGLVLVLGAFVDEDRGIGWNWLIAGSYLFGASLVACCAYLRLNFRLFRISRALDADIRELRSRRVGEAAATAVHRVEVTRRSLAISSFAFLSVAFLVASVPRSSDAAVATVAVILAVGGLAGITALVVRRRDASGRRDAVGAPEP